MRKPLFAVFPILEQRFLWAFPERQKRHQDLRKFMNMLDEVIAHKRKILKEEYDASSASKPENEKDLLTLMIESENKGEGALSNEELKVMEEFIVVSKQARRDFIRLTCKLHSPTCASSSLLVTIRRLMHCPLQCTTWLPIP